MRYSDIKIKEKDNKLKPLGAGQKPANVGYDMDDLFTVIVQVDTTKKLYQLDNVPYKFLIKGKDPVYKKLKAHIERTAKDIKKPFKIKAVMTIDKNGKKQPYQDILPSVDGDRDSIQINLQDIVSMDTLKAISEFKKWKNDPDRTKYKKDERATVNLSKEQISNLMIVEEGKDIGALVDRRTGKAIGAIANTPFADRLDKIMNSKPVNLPGMLGIVDVTGAEGEDGDEGLTGEQAGSAGSIADAIYKSIKGMGTDETSLFAALERIESEAHLRRVGTVYEKKYKGNVFKDIEADFDFDISGDNQYQVDEMNRIMAKFGVVLLGKKIFNLEGGFGYVWTSVKDIRVNKDPSILLSERGFFYSIGFMAQGRNYGVVRYGPGKYKVGIKYVPLENTEVANSAPPLGDQQASAVERFEAGSVKKVGKLRDGWVITLLDDAFGNLQDTIGSDLRLPKLKAGDPVTEIVYNQIISMGKNGVKILDLLHEGEGKYMPLTKEVADFLNKHKAKGSK